MALAACRLDLVHHIILISMHPPVLEREQRQGLSAHARDLSGRTALLWLLNIMLQSAAIMLLIFILFWQRIGYS